MSEQPVLSFHVRVTTFDDVPAIVELAAKCGEDPRVVGQGCRRVLCEPYGFSVVVTARTDGSERLAGVLSIPVLRPRLGNRIRQDGVPFRDLLGAGTERLVANEDEVGRQNGDSGNDMIISHYFQDPTLPAQSKERVMTMLASGFVDRFAGNKVRSVLIEARGLEMAKGAGAAGYETVETYEEWFRQGGRDEATRPILVQSERSLAARSHNFLLMRLLDYQPPVLRLPPAAREVVRAAYLGYSDSRIVSEFGLTTASLNSRWTRILDIAEGKMPSLFANGSRARQRDRQPLLAYLRHHPEEMWPYEPQRE